MLRGLKVSSLACECVCYRSEQNVKGDPTKLNFKGLEMKKRKISKDRAQRLDEENGVICPVIMFSPSVMVI